MDKKLKILLIAPFYDKTATGEAWCTYKWVEGISNHCETSILTTHNESWIPESSPTGAAETINWPHRSIKGRFARIYYELKPHYIPFYFNARNWIKKKIKDGSYDFDLIHQINPVALRYPSPAQGLGKKFIMGPHAGSLETPKGFKNEGSDKQWFRKMRKFDTIRIRYDPTMRRTFSQAECVLGVAPYVKEFLSSIPLKRFITMAETGPEKIISQIKKSPPPNEPLKLLFVGRIIRTKGVIDAIRAVAQAASSANITFDIIGEGDMFDACKAEIKKLNASRIITMHGRIPKEKVFKWYQKSDIFLFPSFREPSGTVVFEALGFGLPLITANRGGPGYVIDESCGYRVDIETPKQFANDLAEAIIGIDINRKRIPKLSKAALARVHEVADWGKRHDRLLQIYQDATLPTNPNNSDQ